MTDLEKEYIISLEVRIANLEQRLRSVEQSQAFRGEHKSKYTCLDDIRKDMWGSKL